MSQFINGIFSNTVICFLISFFLMLPVTSHAQSISKDSTSLQTSPTGTVTKITNLSESGDKDANGAKVAPSYLQQTGINAETLGFGRSINVHVLGDVKNPGVFKVGVSDRVFDVLKLSFPNRSTVRMIEVRHEGGKTRTYDLYQYEYNGILSHNPYLADDDTIFVPKDKGAIRIEGPVARPGVYELNYEKNLEDVVRLAGGFSSGVLQSYPIHVIRFDHAGKKNVLEVVFEKTAIKKFKIEKGDIIIVADKINADKKFDYSVEAIPGENMVYPTSVPDVFVIGAVNTPGPYPYKSQFTIKDYLGFSGATADATFHNVVVIRDGKKKRRKIYETVFAGDVIIVKQKNLNEFMKYVGIASTLMSVTLSAIVIRDVVK